MVQVHCQGKGRGGERAMRGGFLTSCDGPWSNVPRERKMAGKRGGGGRGEDKEQDSFVRMVSREGERRGGKQQILTRYVHCG